ncbi:MAG: hypothetical protein HY678_08090 [Chloroflexi bacterium]|nr:hypothetical protein [Chloroflexota bacterium]
MLAVVAALRDEISPVLRRGFKPVAAAPRGLAFLADGGSGKETLLLVTGWGGEDAAAGARWLSDNHHPEAIVGIGFSGGTAPDLKPGGLVVATETLQLDATGIPGGGLPVPSDPGLIDTAVAAAGGPESLVAKGRIATTPRIVHSGPEKRSLGERTGVLAVDLESWHVATVARDAGIPFVAVRAVVDPVDEDLPTFVSHIPHGAAPPAAASALRFVLTNPSRLPGVMRTGFEAAKARQAIAKFLAKFPLSWEAGRREDPVGAGHR